MWMSKVKRVALMLLVLSVAAVGGGMLWHHAATAQPEQAAAADKNKNKDREKPSGTAVPARLDPAEEADRIRPGDRLQIRVSGPLLPSWEDINGVFRVEPKGTVSLGPGPGRVNLKGQTLDEAEQTIKRHLSRFVQNVGGVAVTRYDAVTSDEQYSALERRVRQLEDEVRSLRATVERLQKGK